MELHDNGSWVALEVGAIENSGEHRAHGEREIRASWVAFEVYARELEQWRTQST